MIGDMLRYNDKEELKLACTTHTINDSSELVKILRGL